VRRVGFETVTIVRPVRDRHGDPVGNYAAYDEGYSGTDVNVDGCAIWPWISRTGGSPASHALETSFESETVVFGLTVLFPPGTDIRAADQVRARGDLYNVYGEPQDQRSAITGRDRGVLVYIRSGTG